jgi:hypothetical protein
MSWIKDNKFLVTLGGSTLVAAIVLVVVGSNGSARYQAALKDFKSAAGEATRFARLPLYPNDENRNGKTKALDEYREAVGTLQDAFGKFRPAELKNVSPQDFTNELKAVNEQVLKAFEESGTKVPEPFFSGFENYKASLARSESTGILSYQLGGIKNLLLALAKAGPSELRNLHRAPLPEESGGAFAPMPGEVARPLALEITFLGSEKSVREFLSDIAKLDAQFVVIRSLRISNAKKEPPRASDAKFDKEASVTPPTAPADDNPSEGFFPTDEEVADPEPTAKTDEEPVVKPEQKAVPVPVTPVTSSRTLYQVLGNEELQVFLRIELMQFLPAKPLP